jgi:hypothetical protein
MRLYVINNGKEALARSLIQREIYLLAIATQIDAGVFPIQEIADAHTYTRLCSFLSISHALHVVCRQQLLYAARLDGRNLMPLLCNADIYFVFPAAEKRLKSAFSCMCVCEREQKKKRRPSEKNYVRPLVDIRCSSSRKRTRTTVLLLRRQRI